MYNDIDFITRVRNWLWKVTVEGCGRVEDFIIQDTSARWAEI